MIHPDPTFTPLREKGNFKKFIPGLQVKKKESDPDAETINPDIIALCSRNGMARGAMEVYLNGELTWQECLELMVVALGRELLVNQKIQVATRNELLEFLKPNKTLQLTNGLHSTTTDEPREDSVLPLRESSSADPIPALDEVR